MLAFSSFALYISVARQGSKLRDVQRQDGAVTWQGTDAMTGLMQMQGTFVGRAAHLEDDEMVKDAACMLRMTFGVPMFRAGTSASSFII